MKVRFNNYNNMGGIICGVKTISQMLKDFEIECPARRHPRRYLLHPPDASLAYEGSKSRLCHYGDNEKKVQNICKNLNY